MNITIVFLYTLLKVITSPVSFIHRCILLLNATTIFIGSLCHSKKELVVLTMILSYEMLSVEAESTYCFCLQCKVARIKRNAT